jgi:hypothetical protein
MVLKSIWLSESTKLILLILTDCFSFEIDYKAGFACIHALERTTKHDYLMLVFVVPERAHIFEHRQINRLKLCNIEGGSDSYWLPLDRPALQKQFEVNALKVVLHEFFERLRARTIHTADHAESFTPRHCISKDIQPPVLHDAERDPFPLGQKRWHGAPGADFTLLSVKCTICARDVENLAGAAELLPPAADNENALAKIYGAKVCFRLWHRVTRNKSECDEIVTETLAEVF